MVAEIVAWDRVFEVVLGLAGSACVIAFSVRRARRTFVRRHGDRAPGFRALPYRVRRRLLRDVRSRRPIPAERARDVLDVIDLTFALRRAQRIRGHGYGRSAKLYVGSLTVWVVALAFSHGTVSALALIFVAYLSPLAVLASVSFVQHMRWESVWPPRLTAARESAEQALAARETTRD